MIILFALFCIIVHIVTALSLPSNSSSSIYNNSWVPFFPSKCSHFRDLTDSSLFRSNLATTLSFSAVILDHNNNDITSSFQILLYSQHQHAHASPPTSPTNSTASPHHRRRFRSRLVNECTNHEQFLSSHCNPIDGHLGALQAYTVFCRHALAGGQPTASGRNPISRRQGHCEQTEICIDDTSRISLATPPNSEGVHTRIFTVPTAMCVTDDAFEPTGPDWQADSLVKFWAAGGGLMGDNTPAKIKAVLSRWDRSTPMEVDRLTIEGQGSSSGGGKQEQAACRDCVGLGMKVDRPLEELKVEARVMTTAQVGMMGVLWLAAMSG